MEAFPKTLIGNEQGVPDLSEFGDVYDLNFGLGEDHPPTSMMLRKEFQRTILYQQSSQEVCIYNILHGQWTNCCSEWIICEGYSPAHSLSTFVQDSMLASILLRPFPAVLQTARFGCVDDGVKSPVNAVHRVYIKTANDRTLKVEQQEAMIHRWPPRKVMVMDTDHSPFFSAPDHLLELILGSLWLVANRIGNPIGGLICSLSYVICQFELQCINRLFVSCLPQNIIS